ncbi:MAG: hypothetical protein ACYTEZ_08940 [Planctomycetota bacterium]|jgi:hypothetical protein
MRRAGPILLLLAACASAPPTPEELPANREDVAAALHAQLDDVLARRAAIADDEGEAAERERAELKRLADEIAVRIVRIDPDADVDALVAKLESAR